MYTWTAYPCFHSLLKITCNTYMNFVPLLPQFPHMYKTWINQIVDTLSMHKCIKAGDSCRNAILNQSTGTCISFAKIILMHLPSQNGSRSPCIRYTPKENRLQFEKICKYIKFIQSRSMPPWPLISLPYDIVDVAVVDAAFRGFNIQCL